MIIDGIIKNTTKTEDVNDGVWGIETNSNFYECGDLLAELDIFLNNQNEKPTIHGTKIKIIID